MRAISQIYIAVLILGLNLVAAPVSAAAANSPKIEPVCQAKPNSAGEYVIAEDTRANTVRLNTLLEDLTALTSAFNSTRNDLFERTTKADSRVSAADSLAVKLNDIKKRIESELAQKWSTKQIAILNKIIEQYFEIARLDLGLRFYKQPYFITRFADAQILYTLSLPTQRWIELNLNGHVGSAEELGSKTVASRSETQISIVPEMIIAVATEIAGASETLRFSNQNVFETTRCVLTNTTIQQFMIQEQFRGVSHPTITLPKAAKVTGCLGLPVSEFITLYDKRANEVSAARVRVNLGQTVFSIEDIASNELKDFLKDIAIDYRVLAEVVMNPLMAMLFTNLKNIDANKLRTWFIDTTNNADHAATYYNHLARATQSREFLDVMARLIGSCPVDASLTNENSKVEATQKLLADLLTVERVLDLRIGNFTQLYVGHLEDLNEHDLKEALVTLLINKKLNDLKDVVGIFYNIKFSTKTPERDDVTAAIEDSLYSAANHFVTDAIRDPEVNSWLDRIAQKILESKKVLPAQTQKDIISARFDKYIAFSIMANLIRDPETPPSAIKFKAKEMGATRTAGISRNLVGKNAARMAVLFKQKSDDGLREVWHEIDQRLTAEASTVGASCETAGWFAAKIESSEKSQFRKECVTMRLAAKVMGLIQSGTPQTLGDILPTLNNMVKKAEMTQKELDATLDLYRDELVSQTLADTRFLKMRYADDQRNEKAAFVYQAVAKSKTKEEAYKILNWALWKSGQYLSNVISVTTTAARIGDFDPILPAANQLSSQISDSAVSFSVEARQAQIMRTANIGEDIYDSASNFYNKSFLVGMGLGAARFGLPFLARNKLSDALVSAVGTTNLRLAPLMADLMATSVFVPMTAIDADMQWSRYRSTRDSSFSHLNDIYWGQGIKVASALADDDHFDQLTAAYNEKMSTAKFKGYTDAGTIVAYFGFLAAASKIGTSEKLSWVPFTVARKIRNLNKAIMLNDREALLKAELAIEKLADRDLKGLRAAWRALGRPSSLRLEELQNSLRSIRLAKASTTGQISDAELAYREIVNTIGGRVDALSGKDQFLDIYRRVIFDSNGSAQDLWVIHAEYNRLFSGGEL